ncbi:hypothetical protein O0Q50_23105 [Priestia aryabhattai]|uniref:Uncharacterized protein n=1 Tax=Priestia aryabhattai TaxID=412384 RepID=A0AAX6NEZ9_PRIAR|nr:hypothetical protein [Priestia aryabhattai]MDU9694075.1 hypothetical protein [Priestia aryabhattai]
MIKIKALTTDESLRVTQGKVYLAEENDGEKELIILDDDQSRNSSVAYHEKGYMYDQDFQKKFLYL